MTLTAADAQAMQDSATEHKAWLVWFVTAADLEHPGKITARAHEADHRGGTVLPGGLVVDTLDELRALLPAGLTRRDRASVHPPDVLEIWD